MGLGPGPISKEHLLRYLEGQETFAEGQLKKERGRALALTALSASTFDRAATHAVECNQQADVHARELEVIGVLKKLVEDEL